MISKVLRFMFSYFCDDLNREHNIKQRGEVLTPKRFRKWS